MHLQRVGRRGGGGDKCLKRCRQHGGQMVRFDPTSVCERERDGGREQEQDNVI